MAGTKAGGLKTAATNKARYGEDYYRKLGQLGGRNGHTGGFATMSYALRAKYGRMGGLKSRRGKAKAR